MMYSVMYSILNTREDKMEIENIQRKERPEKKIGISIRILKSQSDFMREKNISPTKLFVAVLEELIESK